MERTVQLNTFSIVACDLDEQGWGVAVASKFLAAAAVVSWAQAGAGAIATQALARVGYGPAGLAMQCCAGSAAPVMAPFSPTARSTDTRTVAEHGGSRGL